MNPIDRMIDESNRDNLLTRLAELRLQLRQIHMEREMLETRGRIILKKIHLTRKMLGRDA